jgi:hypothetical protein
MVEPGSAAQDQAAMLEARISELRSLLGAATRNKDTARQTDLHAELRQVQREYATALDTDLAAEDAEPPSPPEPRIRTDSAVLPVREQVYQALAILGAAAAPKLISAVHQAFFHAEIVTARLASLRRDEARSFTAQPYSRPYYVCAALTFDRLIAARGVLALSVWPLEQRIIGPLGPRVDFLTHAVSIAQQMQRINGAGQRPSPQATRLLRRFTANIPGAGDPFDEPELEQVVNAAKAELEVHIAVDTAQRSDAAARALAQLTDVGRLFGSPGLGIVRTVMNA